MKKLFLSGIVCMLSFFVSAQIANPGFEALNPDGSAAYWQRLPYVIVFPIDTGCSQSGSPDSMALVTTDAHSGSYAFELSAVNFCDTMGSSGNIRPVHYNADTAFVDQRVPFTSRPAAFTFYYKFTSVKDDYARIYALLENDSETVAEGTLYLRTSATSWIQGVVPLTYMSTDAPLYLTMSFQLLNDSLVHHGSRFVIDDVGQTGIAGIDEVRSVQAAMHCFPIPVQDELTVQLNRAMGSFTSVITDAMGRVVQKDQLTLQGGTGQLNVAGLPHGIYQLQVSGRDVVARGRFVK